MGFLQPLGVDYKSSSWGSTLKEITFHINHDKPILGTIQNLPVLGATLHQKKFEFVNPPPNDLSLVNLFMNQNGR